MESLKGWKFVVNNCVDKTKPPWSNSRYNYLKGEASVEFLKWAHMLQTTTCRHISKNIYRDGTLNSSVSSKRKTRPRPPVQDRETITTSNRKSAAHSPGSEGWVFPWQWAVILAESPFHSKTWHRFPHDIVSRRLPKKKRTEPALDWKTQASLHFVIVMMLIAAWWSYMRFVLSLLLCPCLFQD